MKPKGMFRALYVLYQDFLGLVNDVFQIAHRHLKFIFKPFICDAVEKAAFEDLPVAFAENPLVNKSFPIVAAKVDLVFHFIASSF